MAAVHHLRRPPCTTGSGIDAPSSAESVHHEAGINAPWIAECLHHGAGVRRSGIKPYKYLMLVLSMLPYLGKSLVHEEPGKLMLWYPVVRHRERMRK